MNSSSSEEYQFSVEASDNGTKSKSLQELAKNPSPKANIINPEEKLHIDIRWTMLMVNVSDEKHSFSKFQKCEKHGINM
ncbi:hypothetical protein, partial [Phocaeicola sp.]|uniref:hypothetical protein n=1 Tax=Phocaeicola sp. TaxID=2773926 RepID=UPI003AB387A5